MCKYNQLLLEGYIIRATITNHDRLGPCGVWKLLVHGVEVSRCNLKLVPEKQVT
jgi:hypothetical protein